MSISILSPMRNESAHIEEMLDSLWSQDYADWELLAVDDGSSDDTASKLASAASHDARVHLVSQGITLGKAAAFNTAFAESTGDVVILLAGDDRLPPNSLRQRWEDLEDLSAQPALASYKLRTFSSNKSFSGMTIPRGSGTSTSGGVLTMTRPLAEMIFPIPEELPSEDIWLGYAAPRLARRHIKQSTIVLEYRIHPGNSNPRNDEFATMTEKIALRHEAWRLLAESDLPFTSEDRRELSALYAAELQRRSGSVLGVVRSPGNPVATRLGLASMANRSLFRIRTRFYSQLSGWRRR